MAAGLAAVTLLSLGGLQVATGQTIMPRDVAAIPAVDPNAAVYETAIAGGEGRAIALYHVLPVGKKQRLGYSVAEESGGTWSSVDEGLIDPNSYPDRNFTDPSIAYDSVTGDSLAVAMAWYVHSEEDRISSIVVSRFDASSGTFGDWEEISTTGKNDKPWIVAGEVGEIPAFGPFDPIEYQEFYITWMGPENQLRYARSTDGGYNWNSSSNFDALTDPDDPNTIISIFALPVPRVFSDGPLYVAGTADYYGMTFVRGNDINSGSHSGEVQFKRLLDYDASGNPPLEVSRFMSTGMVAQLTPAPYQVIPAGSHGGPGYDMAVDPTDPDRLFVIYHDTSSPVFDPNWVPDPNAPCPVIDGDVNIYMNVLTHMTGAKWRIESRILVADDSDNQVETDQFLPAVDVDPKGVIHVIYYDDRDFDQDDDDTGTQFDVYYAWSDTQGSTWTHFELCDDPNNSWTNTEPAVDFTLQSNFALRDYIGIDAVGGQVWTSFMGHSSARDAYDDKSLIWSTLIFP